MRFANGKEERALRRGAAHLTLEACSRKGYRLAGGEEVHLSAPVRTQRTADILRFGQLFGLG